MKRGAASEQKVPIPLEPRVAVVEVDLAVVSVAPQVQRIRDTVRVANVQYAIWFMSKKISSFFGIAPSSHKATTDNPPA